MYMKYTKDKRTVQKQIKLVWKTNWDSRWKKTQENNYVSGYGYCVA